MTHHIKVKDLYYAYPGTNKNVKYALSNINISIEKGDFIGLIGHTGSGKSTFIKQLNGLLRPTKGQVLLNDRDIWCEPKKIRDVRFNVGMVFQYPEDQIFEDTVYKEIAFGPNNMGLSDVEIKKRVEMAMDFVGLSQDLIYKSPFELSGGEKRRVAIAGIIAMEPEILVLDEPTAGLDPLARKYLLERIFEYHMAKRNTVILVSHIMEDIAEYSNKVLALDAGKVVMFDETKRVFSNKDVLLDLGLNLPQITSIMNKLKVFLPDLDDCILTVDEAVRNILTFLERSKISYGE